jgi:hypothetical protein
MNNKKKSMLLLMLCILNIGCAQTPPNSRSDKKYQEYKNKFEKKFIDHFPDSITKFLNRSSIFSDRDEKKNDYALLLYEYGVSDAEIKTVEDKFKTIAMVKYKSSDSCLLIVNRFETRHTIENYEFPEIRDSTLLNRSCYVNRLPIPNFINYEEYNQDRSLRLDDTFLIYVLDAKKVSSWENEFGMGPALQMPEHWKNGYSKGVAVSQEKQTIIYWTVIW